MNGRHCQIAGRCGEGTRGQEHHPLVVRQRRPCQSEKGTLGQGRRDCRTQQAAQGTSGRKGAVARAAQAGNRETAGRLSKRDRGSHPQGGSCRAVVKGERYRHRKATETDRLA